MSDKHIAVSFTDNQPIVMEELVEIQSSDMLFAISVDPAEGIQYYKGLVLRQHFFLYFTLADCSCLRCDDASH